MIRIHSNQFKESVIETHSISEPTTVHEWLASNIDGFRSAGFHPLLVYVDGKSIPVKEWSSEKIDCNSSVDIKPSALGGVLESVGGWIANPFYAASSALFSETMHYLRSWLMPGMPDSKTRAQGKSLTSGDINANTARPLDPIREVFGTYKIYPDYIMPPVERFVNKRFLYSEHFMAVCAGSVNIDASNIKIGETPIRYLGSDASYNIYAPGVNVGNDSRSVIWHNSPEVGATNGGKAGLDLGSTVSSEGVTAAGINVSGKTVTLTGAGAAYPSAWASGTDVIIQLLGIYDVQSAVSGRSRIVGDFRDLQPYVGMKVSLYDQGQQTEYSLVVTTISGTSTATGTVTFDYDNGSPFFTSLLAIGGSIGLRGNRFRIVSISGLTSTVDRLFDDGTVDSSWTGFNPARSITGASYRYSTTGYQSQWIGPFVATPSGRKTTRIEYDIYFPNGLNKYNDDGDIVSVTRSIQVQWRDSETQGAWTTINHSYTDNTPDSIGYTYGINFPSAIVPEIRIKRVQAEGEDRVTDKILWYRLRSRMPERPTSYAGVTTMAITLRSGDRIGAQTDRKISVIASKPNTTIQDAFYQVTDSLNVPRSLIDQDEITRLQSTYWTPRGDNFNFSASGQITARDMLNTILAAGHSRLYPANGLISAVREGVAPISGIITPHEQTRPVKVSFTMPSRDDFNGVDVEYMDSNTWKTETVECRMSGVTATKVETINLDGVTNRTKAWRIGMRVLRKHMLQRLSFDTETELDARNYELGSIIRFIDDIPETTASALVVGAATQGGVTSIRISEPIELTMTNRFVFRRNDGTATGLIVPVSVGYYSASFNASDLDFEIITDGSIEPIRVVVCTMTEQGYDGIIASINPSNDGSTTVTAIEYSPEYYADDDNSPS